MPRRRQALLLPGRNYSVQGPLLMFTHVALQSRGAHTYPLKWQGVDRLAADEQAMIDGVCEQTEAVLDRVHNDDPPLLVGKSLGTAAAILAAHHGLPAIWFTPLLQHYPIVQALRRATAPFLLIGGSADPAWNKSLARELPGRGLRDPRRRPRHVPSADAPSWTPRTRWRTCSKRYEHSSNTVVWPRQG